MRHILSISSLAIVGALLGTSLVHAAPAMPRAEKPEPVAQAEIPEGEVDTSERTIWDGVFTEEQSAAGKVTYRANCSSCHGPTGRGSSGGPALSGAALYSNWEDTTLLDWYTFAHSAMPPSGPGTSGSPQDYVNIMAHILDLHGADAGESQLVYNEESLGNIFIVKKPK